MRITPLDIRKQEFKKTMRGLDSDEVYAFLTTVAEEYETVLSDNKRLRERIVEIEERLTEFKSMETNLRNTLLTAEKITAEAKENARKEAGLIVREAEVEAEKAAEAIRAHTQQLRREILELKKNKDNYITRLRTLLDSHQNVITGFEDDFAEVDREIEKIGQKVEDDTKEAVKGTTRMSRDRIEENDKVTWDDEQRREDIPRPSMPNPQHGPNGTQPGEAAPEEEASMTSQPEVQSTEHVTGKVEPEVIVDSDHAAEEKMEAVRQPDLGLSENTEEAASGSEEIISQANMEASRVDFAGVDAEKIDIVDDSDPGPDGHFNEGTVRREVARSIEDSMYPQTDIKETGVSPQNTTQPVEPQAAMPQQPGTGMQQPAAMQPSAPMQQPTAGPENGQQESAQPQGMVVTMDQPQATQAETQPESGTQEQARRSDDWKSYEVDEAKQDWSQYEINAGQKAAPAQPQVSEEPSDNEVEAALSGLEEMNGPTPEPQAAMPQQDVQPVAEQPAQQNQPEPRQSEPQQQSDAAGSQDEGSTWSMEELRKNLSNIDRED